MENYCPHKDKTEKMAKYHSEDFKFLCFIHLDNTCEYSQQMQGCNVCEDCPVFGGQCGFCQLSTGGAVASAVKLNMLKKDITVN